MHNAWTNFMYILILQPLNHCALGTIDFSNEDLINFSDLTYVPISKSPISNIMYMYSCFEIMCIFMFQAKACTLCTFGS